MKFYNLGSGSSGNCYVIKFSWVEKSKDRMTWGEMVEKSTSLMIECGFTHQELYRRAALNHVDLSQIKTVLVSHEHGDHAACVQYLEKMGKHIYGPESLLSKKCVNLNYVMVPNETKIIDEDLLVLPFALHHDVECLGYVIYHRKSNEKVLFITDTKYVESDVITKYKFDYIIIECNYDNAQAHIIYNQAKNAINNGATSSEYFNAIRDYKRVLDTHMSNTTCQKTLAVINNSVSLNSCKAIFLIHMSERHSKKALYEKKDFEALFHKQVLICRANGGVI